MIPIDFRASFVLPRAGPMLFRRGNYVYLIVAHSIWDSSYYAAAWVAAPTVEELDIYYQNGVPSPNRLVGRLLIPSFNQSFGHGTAVLGPDNESMYFIHHHLNHTNCVTDQDVCPRDIYLSPILFEDRNDGLGDVYIKEFFPAEQPGLRVGVTQYPLPPADSSDGGIGSIGLVAFLLSLALLTLACVCFLCHHAATPSRDVGEGGRPLYAVQPSPSSSSHTSNHGPEAALLQHQYNVSARQQ
jgi:hypothetical protein